MAIEPTHILLLAELRARFARAAIILAHQAARKAAKAELRAQGLKPSVDEGEHD